MQDPTLGNESAGEGAEDLELELEGDGVADPEQGGDPLDEISDPVVRAEAKKHRAIARRQGKNGESDGEVVTPPAPADPQGFLKKEDFYRGNEKKAIRTATADPEVKANWDKIVPFFTSRHGKDTPEDILEDINDAIILFRAKNPPEGSEDNGVADLTATVVTPAGGGPAPKTTPKVPEPPNFRLPSQPDQWYGKKES